MKKSDYIKNFIIGSIIGIGILLLQGCSDSDYYDECEKDSKKEMNAYISQNNISDEYQKNVDGSVLYYIEDTLGTGLFPEKDNYIVLDYTGMYLDGTIIETTDSLLKDEWAAADYYKDYVYGPTKFKFGYSRPGFNVGLSYMQEGGWATLIIPTELAYYDCRPVLYKMHLITVIKDPVAYEKSVLLRYLSENGMDTTTHAYKDIYYKETRDISDTVSAEDNDTLVIRFSGKYTYINNGTLCLKEFDSNINDTEPLKVISGNNTIADGSIKFMPDGFKTALDTMRKGAHAVAIMPYEAAFGTTGLVNSLYGYFIVPAYQTVVYNLYMEDIIHSESK
ncbi:MAG: FKBP-type peptidyl-prolyl cis-trans isomerase [Bacteroidales bacterium]|nr:FKBP-type peptidyl-prolyl cis-trans isomerase [Bacteroidales bacterium]